jgi:hypothetical protein
MDNVLYCSSSIVLSFHFLLHFLCAVLLQPQRARMPPPEPVHLLFQLSEAIYISVFSQIIPLSEVLLDHPIENDIHIHLSFLFLISLFCMYLLAPNIQNYLFIYNFSVYIFFLERG